MNIQINFQRRLLAIILLFIIAVPAIAMSRPPELVGVEMSSELEPIMIEAVRDHNLALNGDNNLAADIVSRLEKAESDIAQGHPVLLAYLGSAYTLMGRDADSVSNAIRYTNRGIRTIDEAVEIAPENFTVRAVRAFNNTALPIMFERQNTGINDMKELVTLYEKNPLPSRQTVIKAALEKLIEVSEENKNTEDTTLWNKKLNGLNLD